MYSKQFFSKKISQHKSKIYHALGWSVFIGVQLMIIAVFRERFNALYFIVPWLIWIAYFYINYLVLLPRFLFKKKLGIYAITVLLVSSVFYLSDREINEYFHKDKNEKVEQIETKAPKSNKTNRKKFPKIFSWYNILLYFAGSTALAFIDKWQISEKEKKEIEREHIGSELAYLKQQINPHFLFNSLNNIYSLAYRKSDATTDAILKLSAILRYMLYDTDKQNVALDKEIETIKDYIELQKLRLNDLTDIEFEVNGNVNNHSIAPLLLIPLVENAFKYGTDNVTPSHINILLNIEPEGFSFCIENKIVVKLPNTENSGIGLKNIKRRLQLLYASNHTFELEEKKNTFVVTMTLKNAV